MFGATKVGDKNCQLQQHCESKKQNKEANGGIGNRLQGEGSIFGVSAIKDAVGGVHVGSRLSLRLLQLPGIMKGYDKH